MNVWVDHFYFFVCGALLAMTTLGLGISFVMPDNDRWNSRFFVTIFTIQVLCIGAFTVDMIVYSNPTMATAERIVIVLECLLISLPMPLFTDYLLHCCGEDRRKSLLFRAVLALWGVYLFHLGAAQFTTVFYYVTSDNQFYRGPWHSLPMILIAVIMLLNLAGVLRRRKKLSEKYFVAFLVHLLPMTVAIVVHTVVYSASFVAIGLTFSTLSMFGVILCDQIDRSMRQQWKIAHQRASIMVLQMRPHFIYNTMMSIYYLCEQAPKKAQQVTMDFTAYLRKNFTAIASEAPIPFSDELEHTRAYLAVEQALFEDNLFVSYDTPHTRFRVPPLTLQPIVENAVKHGMDPDSGPLRISIHTRATDAGSEIIVEDNGHGFTLAAESEPHIALTNIRTRLELLCGGKLTVAPRQEGGTMVTVTIPER